MYLQWKVFEFCTNYKWYTWVTMDEIFKSTGIHKTVTSMCDLSLACYVKSKHYNTVNSINKDS